MERTDVLPLRIRRIPIDGREYWARSTYTGFDVWFFIGMAGTMSKHKRVLYEQVTDVKRWSLFFHFSGSLLLLLRGRLLSTGFVFALWMSCLAVQARCGLGFERRVDAAISRAASGAKTRTQSSEHGVVATGKRLGDGPISWQEIS
jgi:hypothetical protein